MLAARTQPAFNKGFSFLKIYVFFPPLSEERGIISLRVL
jgi:hypothetical protein